MIKKSHYKEEKGTEEEQEEKEKGKGKKEEEEESPQGALPVIYKGDRR